MRVASGSANNERRIDEGTEWMTAQVEGAIARRQYDFVLYPIPDDAPVAEQQFAARVYSHQPAPPTEGAPR